MKIEINKNGELELREVYNSLHLVTNDGEKITIVMRDNGFEFFYGGEMYFAKQGYLEPFHKSTRDNYLVSELQHHREDTTCIN